MRKCWGLYNNLFQALAVKIGYGGDSAVIFFLTGFVKCFFLYIFKQSHDLKSKIHWILISNQKRKQVAQLNK